MSARIVPAFPLTPEPGTWSELELLAATIYLEAEGEPMEGKLGVGWVVRNRMDLWHQTLRRVILGADERAWDDGHAFEVFSAWNDDYRERGRARLSAADGPETEASWRAAAGAYWRLVPNPIGTATFYLNIDVTRKIRKGTLPDWAALASDKTKINAEKVTAVLGRHTFLVG